ncbi:hypothetical protein [uncultured Shimia sp.]|uniref:hypothetical protein n=1 Tax=uncultured Shimia sp. TaxID=573152 RepID=UPI0025D47362|nr:hypothetical protein [uncultured Shimia sp.]
MSFHVLTSLKIQSFLTVAKQSLKQRMRPQVRARRKAGIAPNGPPADPTAFFFWSLERHKEARAKRKVISGDNGLLLPEIAELDPHLRKLCIRHTPITDVSALRGLPSLVELEIIASPVADLSPLADLPNLAKLTLSIPPETPVSLPNLPNLRFLKLSHPRTPVRLGNMPNLQSADLLALCEDLSQLVQSPALTELKLRLSDGQTLAPLAQAQNLSSLSLRCDGAVDLTALSALSQLETLDLFGAKTTDLSALSALPRLKTLSLWNTPASDFASLAALSTLKNLTIQSLVPVSDLSFVAALTGLNHLSLGQVSQTDLSPLSQLSKLTYLLLQIADPGVDLAPLSHCTALQTLHVRLAESVEGPMTSAWPHLPNLQSASLSGAGIVSLNGLQRCRALQCLQCTGTAVKDLYPLHSLPQLEFLDITDTSVVDLSVLLTLPKFTKANAKATLAINGTPALQSMHDLEALAACANGREFNHYRHVMANRVVDHLRDAATPSSETADA